MQPQNVCEAVTAGHSVARTTFPTGEETHFFKSTVRKRHYAGFLLDSGKVLV